MLYPGSWPFFRNGIMQSGGPTVRGNFFTHYTDSYFIGYYEIDFIFFS